MAERTHKSNVKKGQDEKDIDGLQISPDISTAQHGTSREISRVPLHTYVFELVIYERHKCSDGEEFNPTHLCCNGKHIYLLPMAREMVNDKSDVKAQDNTLLQDKIKSDIDDLKEVIDRAIQDAISGLGADWFIPSYGKYSQDPQAHPGAPEELKKIHKVFSKADSVRRNKRWSRTQGGDRRSKPEWRREEILERFKQRVDSLRLLWEHITRFHKEAGEEWIEDLKHDSTFKFLSQDSEVPSDLLRQVADEEVDKRRREPLALALEHARRELGIPQQSVDTLRKHYQKAKGKGNKILT